MRLNRARRHDCDTTRCPCQKQHNTALAHNLQTTGSAPRDDDDILELVQTQLHG